MIPRPGLLGSEEQLTAPDDVDKVTVQGPSLTCKLWWSGTCVLPLPLSPASSTMLHIHMVFKKHWSNKHKTKLLNWMPPSHSLENLDTPLRRKHKSEVALSGLSQMSMSAKGHFEQTPANVSHCSHLQGNIYRN